MPQPLTKLAAMRKTNPSPTLGKANSGARKARQERLAAALRENLRKRKAQAHERSAPDGRTPTKSEQS